jgi:hypothetical protein
MPCTRPPRIRASDTREVKAINPLVRQQPEVLRELVRQRPLDLGPGPHGIRLGKEIRLAHAAFHSSGRMISTPWVSAAHGTTQSIKTFISCTVMSDVWAFTGSMWPVYWHGS